MATRESTDQGVAQPGFIFTTALPPAICAATTVAIRHLKTSQWERDQHQERAARVKGALSAAVSEYVGSQVLHGNEGGFWGKTLQTVKYALIGGITSKLAHESFEEGFSVAAAGYLFNDAAQTLRNNKAQHDLAVAAVSAELTREGKVVIDTEVGASNPAVPYTRVYDIVVYDPADGNVYGVEVKSTSTGIFRLNAKQVAFDAATVRGGTVTSDGDYLNGVMYHGVSVVDVPATVWATVQLWLALRQAQIPYATTLRPPYP